MTWAKITNSLDENRTEFRTVSLFGQTLSAKVDWEHLPVLTTKEIHLESVIHELIWFLQGNGNIRYLLINGVNIWTANAYEHNRFKEGFPDITIGEYTNKVKSDQAFADLYGNLDGGYGQAWRNFNGVDQIDRALYMLKEHPESRENLISAWNPRETLDMALPPCHVLYQFHVKNNTLSLTMYQRSADWFLGVPFNLTSYAILLLIFAKKLGLEPGSLYMHFGDTHLYEDHFKQAGKQLLRWAFKKRAPRIWISGHVFESDLKDLTRSDFEVQRYHHLSKIRAEMAL